MKVRPFRLIAYDFLNHESKDPVPYFRKVNKYKEVSMSRKRHKKRVNVFVSRGGIRI